MNCGLLQGSKLTKQLLYNNEKNTIISNWFKTTIEFPNHTGCNVEFISTLFQVY